MQTSQTWDKKHLLLLFLMWLTITLINLNKAFHIDDTFHLEVAKWIIHHPFHPMSGTINWYNDPEPFYSANQPPLYFYIVAAWGWLFGFSEVALHLMQSVFTFLCILFFYRVIRLFSEKGAVALTVLFAFNPAFIVNHNLMKEVPLLASLLAFIYTLIRPHVQSDKSRYVTAALVVGAGIMVKYTLLPLVLVLMLVIIQQRRYRFLPVTLIPLALIGLWALLNNNDFSSFSLQQSGSGLSLYKIDERANALVLCIGAITFFPLFVLHGFFPRFKVFSIVAILLSGMAMVWVLATYRHAAPSGRTAEVFSEVLRLNGWLTIVVVANCIFNFVFRQKAGRARRQQMMVVYLCLPGICLFVICFAPFIATRHILLLIPAVLIITASLWENTPAITRYAALSFTIISGLIFGLSDWHFADFYRRAAADVRLHVDGDAKIWSAGHWGWQWYCNEAGIEPIGITTSHIAAGDYIVAPQAISSQDIHKLNLTRVGSYSYQPSVFRIIGKQAGLYAMGRYDMPWSLSNEPVDSISIYRVNAAR